VATPPRLGPLKNHVTVKVLHISMLWLYADGTQAGRCGLLVLFIMMASAAGWIVGSQFNSTVASIVRWWWLGI